MQLKTLKFEPFFFPAAYRNFPLAFLDRIALHRGAHKIKWLKVSAVRCGVIRL